MKPVQRGLMDVQGQVLTVMNLSESQPADVMSDKRQRARVQGSWARQPEPRGPVRPHPEPTTAGTASWEISSQKPTRTFEFQPPSKVALRSIYV